MKKSKDAGVWIVPTSALWEVLFDTIPLETLKALPGAEVRAARRGRRSGRRRTTTAWRRSPREAAKNVIANRTRILRALHEGGVKILMGTDAPQQFSVPGFSLHRELLRMRDAGMSPYEILKSGTVNVGEYFAKQDSFGTIEPGQRADLVLLDANPLADITQRREDLGRDGARTVAVARGPRRGAGEDRGEAQAVAAEWSWFQPARRCAASADSQHPQRTMRIVHSHTEECMTFDVEEGEALAVRRRFHGRGEGARTRPSRSSTRPSRKSRESLGLVLERHPEYRAARILERMVEPERVHHVPRPLAGRPAARSRSTAASASR